MDTSPITGDFQLAVINVIAARDAFATAGFDEVASLHGALTEAMARMMSFAPDIQSRVDDYWEDEDRDYPVVDDGYGVGAALICVYAEFLNMRDSTGSFVTYANCYTCFSDAVSDLSTFCAGFDSDTGNIET